MPVELILFVLRLIFIFALYFFIVLVARVLSRELTVRAPDGAAPAAPSAAGAGRAPDAFGPLSSPAVAPGHAYLVMVDGAGAGIYVGTVFTLFPGALVGRAPTVDLPLPDIYTSSEHARFRYDRGHWLIEDLQSMNGSYVNGQRVAGVAPLGDGDTVQLGRVILQFLLRPPS